MNITMGCRILDPIGFRGFEYEQKYIEPMNPSESLWGAKFFSQQLGFESSKHL